MIPGMTALIALLAVLLSGPTCRAESLGGVPQVVDAGADTPVIDPPSQPPGPPLAPDKNGIGAAAEVEIQRRFNELRREFLDDRREFLDARAKNVDQWLTAIGVVAPIVAFIIGLLGFQRLREIEADARRSAEEAERLVERIRANSDEVEKRLEKLDAQSIGKNVDEAARTAESVQRDPAASVIGRARAAAVLLQQQGKIEEAIEKWRSIANVAGEGDRQLQARAWFSVGYLRSVGEGIDLEAAIDAYTKAIALDPTYATAYYNRGRARHDLGRDRAALADYDQAIKLTPTDAVAYNNRGIVKHCLNQYEAALADFDQAIALDPTYATAYNNRGHAKQEHGQHEDALVDLDQAIALDPTYAVAYYNRGVANQNLGRITKAREDFEKALVLAQEAGDEALVAEVRRHLRRLDNNEEP